MPKNLKVMDFCVLATYIVEGHRTSYFLPYEAGILANLDTLQTLGELSDRDSTESLELDCAVSSCVRITVSFQVNVV